MKFFTLALTTLLFCQLFAQSRVGINTISPISPLDVNGDANFSNNFN